MGPFLDVISKLVEVESIVQRYLEAFEHVIHFNCLVIDENGMLR